MASFLDDQEPEPQSSRMWLYVGAGVIAVIVVGWAVWSSAPEPSEPVEVTAAPPAPTPAAPRAPEPEPPAPAPEPPRPRAPRPAPEPVEEPPAPVPVEVPVELATLRFETDVPGAAVFIDRTFVGNAPVTAEGIKPGTHQLNASVTGYDGIARSLDVVAGSAEVMLRFKEVRLNETIAVVHKKTFGSTEGTLVATTDGIRFDTRNPKDGFTASLSDLQEFEVDYLKKNLKIKLRNGKTFNFTDKRENADALFVFHKNVDSARTRLAAGSSQQ